MSLQRIRTSVNPELFFSQGDVLIAKHVAPGANGSSTSTCTRPGCGRSFKTTFRRMGRVGTKRGCEVRSVPQCPPCRARYAKARKIVAAVAEPLISTWEGEGGAL